MAQLFYQTAFIGDLLLSIPLILELRRRDSENEFHLVCRKGYGGFFRRLGIVDQVFEIDKSKGGESYRHLRKQLRIHSYERVWCPHESIRSALAIRSIQSPQKIGFSHWWNAWIFDQRVRRPMNKPEALRQLSLLGALDKGFSQEIEKWQELNNPTEMNFWRPTHVQKIPQWASMNLMRSGILSSRVHHELEQELQQQMARLELDGRGYVMMAPGSIWPTKRWSSSRYVEVAESLIAQGFEVVLTGSADERDLCATIQKDVPQAKNGAGQSDLWGSFALLKGAQMFIGNDSGASHLATCAGRPVVAQFGPTTLALGYRPWSDQVRVVQHDLPCRPCGKHGSRRCPLGTHACMNQIQSQEVLQAIRELQIEPSQK